MVSPSRSSTSRPRRDQAGRYLVGALMLLGLVASVFLIFSNSLQWIRVGMVAALWAAAIAAMAATKYRKDAAVDQAKIRDLQTVYELQLEREIAARREYELGVEARVREEVGADATEMAALRTELSALRQSLQRLFDGDLPVDRPALRAEAVRVRALPGNSWKGVPSANGNSTDAGAAERTRSSTPVYEPGHSHPAAFAGPDDEPVTAETSVVPAADDPAAEVTRLGTVPWPNPYQMVGDAGTWADAYAGAESEVSTAEAVADSADSASTVATVTGASPVGVASTETAVTGSAVTDAGSADAASTGTAATGVASAGAVATGVVATGAVSRKAASAGVVPTGTAPRGAVPTKASGGAKVTDTASAATAAAETGSAAASTAAVPVGAAPAAAVSTEASPAGAAVAAASGAGAAATGTTAASTSTAAAAQPTATSASATATPASATAPPPAVIGTPSRRRRREETEHESADRRLSVAEIMANLASEQQHSS